MPRRWAALLLLATAGAGAAPAQTPRPVVADVVLEVPPGEEAAALEDMVAVRRGEPLSPRALRRTVQALYQVGRFGNVVARVRPAGRSEVTLLIQCLPKRIIASVRFQVDAVPAAIGEEQLRKIAGLPVGEELFPDRLAGAVEAVRGAYLRRGHRRAQVTARIAGEGEVAIEIRIREGPATVVRAVEVGPVPGKTDAEVRRGLRTVPGATLDQDALEADVRELQARLRAAGYYRGRVEPPRVDVEGESALVAIPIRPGPRFEFRFRGNERFADALLREHLGYDAELPLDTAAIEGAADRLRLFLQERGHYEARVTPEERQPAAGHVAVVFHVDEGRRYRVGAVRFTGSRAHPEADLRARLDAILAEDAPADSPRDRAQLDLLASAAGAPAARPARSVLAYDPRDVFFEASWGRALARLVEQIRDDGYLDAAHEATRAAIDARRGVIDLEIRLREGQRTRVESIAFEGNQALALAELAALSLLAPGDPLSLAKVERTRTALLDLYARRGYLYARVEDQEEFSADRRQAAVRFRVEEGPRVHIGRIFVSGALRTREDVIRATLTVAGGEVYDPEAVSASQSALLRLGVFRSVGLRLDEPEIPEGVKDLTVEVAERPWQTLSLGGGYSIANGPRIFLEYGRPNLLGRALDLTVRGKLNYPLPTYRPDLAGRPPLERLEGRGDVALRYPRIHFLPVPLGASVAAVTERLHRPSYDLGRVSVILGLDVPASSRLGVGLQYELEVDNIRKSPALTSVPPTQADVERLRFPEGVTSLLSLRPFFTVDFRDNSVHPREGAFAGATLDYSRSLGGPGESALLGIVPGSDSFVNMLKVSFWVSGYVPFGSRSVLALSLRGGRVFALSPEAVTLGPKRFYLGGAGSMRGYAEDAMVPEDRRDALAADVQRCATLPTGIGCSTEFRRQVQAGERVPSEGGEAALLLKAELRVPVAGSLEAGFFADVGNLWLDPRKVDLGRLRLSLGFGFRLLTPIGPAAFDVGFNVQPDRRLNEDAVAPHFSIGLF